MIGILVRVLEIELGVGINVVVQISDLHIAGRKNDISLAQRAHDVHRTDLPGFEFERIDVELDLTPRPAKRLRDGCAGNARQLISNEVLRDVFQIAIGHPVAIHGHQAHGQA